MSTSSLHNQVPGEWPQPLLFPHILNKNQEANYWPPATGQQWLGWHSGATFFFFFNVVMPFLVALMVSPLPAGYLHHSLQSNHCQPGKEKPFACGMLFRNKYNKKTLGTFPLSLCYMYAKSSLVIFLSEMMIIVLTLYAIDVIYHASVLGSWRKFDAFSFSLSIWAPYLSLTLWVVLQTSWQQYNCMLCYENLTFNNAPLFIFIFFHLVTQFNNFL